MKTKPNNALGQFEQLVITAIIALGDNAYGLAIQAKLSEYYRDKEVNLGSVYVTLERLEDKGYVSSKFSDPIPERGGRSRQHHGRAAARGGARRGRSAADGGIEPRIAPADLDWTIACSIRSMRAPIAAASG